MADTLLRVFDSFDVAQQARSALIAAGLPESALQMRPQEDDGGPPRGDFVADAAQKPAPRRDAPNRQSSQSEPRGPAPRDTCLLIVTVQDEGQRAVAEQVLVRLARGDRPDSRRAPP
ncbi:hypothetical protein [Pseudoduganella namucuonensis]|uniref:Uncharacterized protein n=1 Tax=Pseudoduganella namucuonensis TaxID=1035707 RepID=A0A1I7L2I4_9BURK|nr:hypothetical protein [Pseudoduganella namucuonensis]SFV03828.1 hypothetical protein SAMN05216552_102260 [Pseudoduganella namucuonensis]